MKRERDVDPKLACWRALVQVKNEQSNSVVYALQTNDERASAALLAGLLPVAARYKNKTRMKEDAWLRKFGKAAAFLLSAQEKDETKFAASLLASLAAMHRGASARASVSVSPAHRLAHNLEKTKNVVVRLNEEIRKLRMVERRLRRELVHYQTLHT